MENLNEQLEELNTNIGHRILKTRTILGITRDELAKFIGISQQQLAKYESGVNRVSASRLSLIAKKFSVNINHFYTDILSFDKKPSVDKSTISYKNLVLIKKLSKLKSKKQNQALSILLDGLIES